jgi:hypothetical protein
MKTERRKARRQEKMKLTEEINDRNAYCPIIDEYKSVCLEDQNYGEWNSTVKEKLNSSL